LLHLCFAATTTCGTNNTYAKWTSAGEMTLVFYFSKESLSAALCLNILNSASRKKHNLRLASLQWMKSLLTFAVTLPQKNSLCCRSFMWYEWLLILSLFL